MNKGKYCTRLAQLRELAYTGPNFIELLHVYPGIAWVLDQEIIVTIQEALVSSEEVLK